MTEEEIFNLEETMLKHGKEPRIVRGEYIGKAPENGQFALDNSVPVSSKDPRRRIGVDPVNNEIVIFDRTGNKVGSDGSVIGGNFHGHVRPVDQLSSAQIKALKEMGVTVSKRGKITISPNLRLNETSK